MTNAMVFHYQYNVAATMGWSRFLASEMAGDREMLGVVGFIGPNPLHPPEM